MFEKLTWQAGSASLDIWARLCEFQLVPEQGSAPCKS